MKLLTNVLIALNLLVISTLVISLIPVTGMNKEISPYYNFALDIIKANCKDNEYNHPDHIKIDFARKLYQKEAIGECLNLGFRYEITLRKDYWERATEDERLILVMHEVAHCALGKLHSEDEKNYMYYMENYLDLPTVINQFTNDAMTHCSKNRRY